MWLEFARPERLILIPVLIFACVAIARRSLSLTSRSGSREGWTKGPAFRPSFGSATIIIARCAVVAILAAALAEPEAIHGAKAMTNIVVRDVSDSVPTSSRKTLDRLLEASMAKRREGDRLGVVTASRDAVVQSLPTAKIDSVVTDHAFIGETSDSDLAQALSLAAAVAPPDTGLRVLLATDGNQTRGDLLSVARALRSRGIVVDVAAMPMDGRPRVVLEELSTPSWARDKSLVNAKVVIRADAPVNARISLRLNGEQIDLDPDSPDASMHVKLDAGLNALSAPVTLTEAGAQRFEAIVEPEGGSSAAGLLAAESVTFVHSRGRVLVLADNPAEVEPLLAAMRDPSITLDVRPGTEAPLTTADWAAYDAAVLVDQPAFSYSLAQQRAMRGFVEDAGGGMIVIGGPRSFGVGGWIGSEVAEILPVDPDPPKRRELPMGALAIVIDRSGSMQAQVAGTGATQQQLANEAAILGIRSLRALDQVTVVAFSGDSRVVVPLTNLSDPAPIEASIRAIGPDGGTNLFPAIHDAASELAKSPAGVKHIIVLTDGQTQGDPVAGAAFVRQLRERGVSLSTVGIGDALGGDLLEQLARLGGGKYYAVRSESSRAVLPQIFIREAQVVGRSLVWEGPPISPTLETPADSIAGLLAGFPPVRGYIVTGDRGGLSSVILRGPKQDPLLAQWQRGLGRVTALTSDSASRWSPGWISWPAFQSFWRQQLAWAMRPAGDPGARLTVTPTASGSLLTLELLTPDGQRTDFARVAGRVSAASGFGGEESKGRDLEVRQIGPGVYQARIDDDERSGLRVATFRYEAPDGDLLRVGTARAAIAAPAGRELRFQRPNQMLLEQVAGVTGGRVYQLTPQAIDLWDREGVTLPRSAIPVWSLFATIGLGLFLVDVAARRLSIPLATASAAMLALIRPPSRRTTTTLDSLTQARDRSRDQTRRRAEPDGRRATPTEQDLTNPNANIPLDRTPATNATTPNRNQAGAASPPAPTQTPDQTLSRLQDIKRRLRDRG